METFNLPELEQKIYNELKKFIVIGAFDGESHDNFFERVKQKLLSQLKNIMTS